MDTPLFRQYQGIKQQHPDKLLLFRMGDFYELFYADAKRISALLGLTLTKRKMASGSVAMAGIPVQSLDQYVARLLRIGESVVVCEQSGSSQGKSLMDREVVQIVTPGTLTDDALLPSSASALALALVPPADGSDGLFGYAWLDLARGELRAGDVKAEKLASLLGRLRPAELLLPDDAGVPAGVTAAVTQLPSWEFDSASAKRRLCEYFDVRDLRGFGLEGLTQACSAAAALLAYAERNQCQRLDQLWQVGAERVDDQVGMDAAARISLEISEPLVEGGVTLRSAIDICVTAAGSRMLRRRLHEPVRNREELEQRQQLVETVSDAAASIAQWLEGSCDLERIVTRIAIKSAKPRDLAALRELLGRLPRLREILGAAAASERLAAINDDLSEPCELLGQALAEEPPALLRDGGVIAAGYDPQLDELRALAAGAREIVAKIEQRERANTAIETLRVGRNRVFGYYIEVPRSRAQSLPDHYQRRQSLKNAERFVIDELRELEERQNSAGVMIEERERDLYLRLVDQLGGHLASLRPLAPALAELDLAAALARLQDERGWVRPSYLDEPSVRIEGGRHPVVERSVEHFVANSTELDKAARMQVITGPNMGGKSTYMRQVAQIALLALAGMPVPAKAAAIGMLDSIQTRIGAADDLAGGRSTFMVEMSETASILNTAGPASLVLLDEIGRGTSTFDGLSLAWSIAETLLERNRSMVLLSTHYLELAEFAENAVGAINVQMAVSLASENVVMLHRVEPGSSSRSYGLQVARAAGMPKHVLAAAAKLLAKLESNSAFSLQLDLFDAAKERGEPAKTEEDLLRERISALAPDSLTPREALELLYELRGIVDRTEKS